VDGQVLLVRLVGAGGSVLRGSRSHTMGCSESTLQGRASAVPGYWDRRYAQSLGFGPKWLPADCGIDPAICSLIAVDAIRWTRLVGVMADDIMVVTVLAMRPLRRDRALCCFERML